MDRRVLLGAALLPAIPPLAQAQEAWPSRVVTIVVPGPAGGSTDVIGRVVAQGMQQSLGKPVVVENRPGANGEIGIRYAARMAPDGHTLVAGSVGHFAINAALRPRLGYDPLKDLSPVTLAVATPNVLVVNPRQVPATDLPGLVAWLKGNTGRVSYSSSGIGSSDQLGMELLKQLTGTDPQHVPYPGGPPALTDVMSGQVQLTFQNVGFVAPHVREGRLRAITITSAERSSLLPEVPTVVEAGLPDLVMTSWQAIMVPAGPEPALLARVHEEVVKALRVPAAVERMASIGFATIANSPEEYGAFQRQELDRWRQVVEAGNIRPE
jgi:tripartite-type tricarboxylate transporter receptor subunit TctC